jgi:hypothetical protein
MNFVLAWKHFRPPHCGHCVWKIGCDMRRSGAAKPRLKLGIDILNSFRAPISRRHGPTWLMSSCLTHALRVRVRPRNWAFYSAWRPILKSPRLVCLLRDLNKWYWRFHYCLRALLFLRKRSASSNCAPSFCSCPSPTSSPRLDHTWLRCDFLIDERCTFAVFYITCTA